MPFSKRPSRLLCALSLLCACLFPGSAAAQLQLPEIPLVVNVSVPPNVIIGVDDSGSMDSEVLFNTNDGALWWNTGESSFVDPDTGQPWFNANGSSSDTWKKYVYLFPIGTGGSESGRRLYGDASHDHFAIPPLPEYACARSPAYNTLYFDPSVTYEPWISTETYRFGDSTPTAARTDPVKGDATLDLTTTFDEGSDGWNEANWRFEFQENMRLENGGISSSQQGRAVPYHPATFYLPEGSATPPGFSTYNQAATISGSGPSGEPLTGYVIAPENFGSSNEYANAIQNFANWFTYHRKRHIATRGGIVASLADFRNLRVGSFRINARNDVSMRNLSRDSERNALFDTLYNYVDSNGTPNKQALDHMGAQFARSDSGAPITEACQRNAGLLFTDGFSNVADTGYGNVDGDKGEPYADNVSDTIADIAMSYYDTRLRTDLPAGRVPAPNSCSLDNPDPRLDCNDDLHMQTFAITLGAEGELYDPDNPFDPYEDPPAWPTSFNNRDPASVDDLWHATINGRGDMLNAKRSEEIRTRLRGVFESFLSDLASSTSVASTSASIREGTQLFQARFDSETWTGELLALELGTDGVLGDVQWEGGDRLGDLAQPALSRDLFTFEPGAGEGREFLWSELSDQQKDLLNRNLSGESDGLGASRVQYLRGDDSLADQDGGGVFRGRESLLGDIVRSDPLVVRRQNFGYSSLAGEEGRSYLFDFRSSDAYATRPNVVYVGANDGILHGFDTESGTELFGYIPSSVFPGLSELTSPDYGHRFFVDGDLSYGDAYLSSQWRTVLLGTTGTGARAVFALDVTNPQAFNASDVLWEFRHPELGFVNGRARVARLASGKWVAVFPNGYNSANHEASLFVVNLEDPSDYTIVRTDTAGDGNDPNGLSGVHLADRNGDGLPDTAYGGDLHGRLWRFDLDDGSSELLFEAEYDGGQRQPITAQPVSAVSPRGERFVFFGTGKFLEPQDAGPGESPLPVQSFYAVKDVPNTQGNSTLDRGDLIEQTIVDEIAQPTGAFRLISRTPVPQSAGGWYVDLVYGSREHERVDVQPQILSARQGLRIAFSTIIPSEDPCDAGGSSWIYELAAFTGQQVSYPVFDLDGNRTLNSVDVVDDRSPGGRQQDSLVRGSLYLDNPEGTDDVRCVSTADGIVCGPTELDSGGGRQTWVERL